MTDRHRALVAVDEGGKSRAVFVDLGPEDLPEGDVTVRVRYSSLNYKDGLAVTGRGKIVRRFPLVCGIDLAGTVEDSVSPDWRPGDEVIVTGWGLSEQHPGGYAQRQRVKSEWIVAKPAELSFEESMALGTAGLTAMLCVLALSDGGVRPGEGSVVVTGAAGGVGSVACALLAHSGYEVVASTGRAETHDYLRALGASGFVDRAELEKGPEAPLAKVTWRGAVDSVGSGTLASVLSRISYGGAVAACGLAGGTDLPTTVLPFILRGVRLQGVESVSCPNPDRRRAWDRLAHDLPREQFSKISRIEPMSKLPELAGEILAGRVRGRVVIDVDA